MILENLDIQKVYRTTQGTNQTQMSHFSDISEKLWALLEHKGVCLSSATIRRIRETQCPHLNELLDSRLNETE